MILYFNDYKLIYIITMMGKINNIPVLNEDVIRLVVLNEEIIGYNLSTKDFLCGGIGDKAGTYYLFGHICQ